MSNLNTRRSHLHRLVVFVCATALLVSLLGITAYEASALPIDVGYQDFAYGPTTLANDPSGAKPESKLWWNDGLWWASMFNVAAAEYRIYRLNWGTQAWEDTGVALDDRDESRADTLWDTASNKLYVTSHIFTENSSAVNDPLNWGRLYRYTYDATNQTYSLDGGFPVTVNEDKTETLVLDKDSSGRLWVTYVSRAQGGMDYQVYVNASDGSDDVWGTPFTLPVAGVHVDVDDIASLIAFDNKIGVMWSNQVDETLNFATHLNSNPDPETGWTLQADILAPHKADDHFSLKMHAADGRVFAALKTNATVSTDPLIGLLERSTGGTWTFHTYSLKSNDDTRPIVLVDEDAALVYVFVTGKPGGSKICYKSSPLSAISFPTGDCGTSFIEDDVLNKIDNATTAKHNLDATTGIVILASDDDNGQYYVHNVLGDPPPVITARSPERNATNVALNANVLVTFSKPMDETTLRNGRFTLASSSGPVSGRRTYDSATRTWIFNPRGLLSANTTYTVTVKGSVTDTSGQPLFGGTERWTFTTGTAAAP